MSEIAPNGVLHTWQFRCGICVVKSPFYTSIAEASSFQAGHMAETHALEYIFEDTFLVTPP